MATLGVASGGEHGRMRFSEQVSFLRQKAAEMGVAVAAIGAALVLGWASARIGLILAGVLNKFPRVAIGMGILFCLVPLVYLLPVVLGAAAIWGTLVVLSWFLTIHWAVIVTVLIWWLIANVLLRLTKPWTSVAPRATRTLIRFWQNTIVWGCQFLGHACPAVLVVTVVLGLLARL
jgi:hypothetical protein